MRAWNKFIEPHILTVIVVAIFTAIIITIQSYILLFQSGAINFIGAVVAVTVIKETGPVITGLLCASMVGDSINQNLYRLRTTDQLDALITLNHDPLKTVITPIAITGVLGTVVLIIYGTAAGIITGFLTCYTLGIPIGYILLDIPTYITHNDIIITLIKSSIFGIIISSVGVYRGITATTFTPAAGLISVLIIIIDALIAYGWWST